MRSKSVGNVEGVEQQVQPAGKAGWGGRIRTCECRHQKPVPYHLATPHYPLLQRAAHIECRNDMGRGRMPLLVQVTARRAGCGRD